MAESTPKSLCRRLTGSVALAAAVLVALTCAAGYFFMARTLLSERYKTMVSQAADKAGALSETADRQRDWLTALADELAGLDPETVLETVPALLEQRGRSNGNLTNLRVMMDGLLYLDGEAAEAPEAPQEEWQHGMRGVLFLDGPPDGPLLLTIAVPIRREGEGGVLAADFPLDDLARNVSRLSPFDGGYAALLDRAGNVISHPGLSRGKQSAAQAYPNTAPSRQGQASEDYDGVKRYFASATAPGPEWKLVLAVDRRTLLRPLDPVLWLIPLAAAIAAGLAALLAAWRLESLADPLRELMRAAGEMEKGRYKLKVRYEENDEFGALCRALERGCERTQRWIDELSHAMGRMAQGDFTVKTDEQYAGDFASIGASIDRIAGALHSVFKQVNLTAKWALGGSHQLSGVSGRLSAGIESQSNSVEQLGKAATLMRHESNQNALNASHAQEAALSVNADLRESARQTGLLRDSLLRADEAVQALRPLLESVRQSVAQGRMLSISVSAEAERAGEQAAAFVMAVDELRTLFDTAWTSAGEAADRLDAAREAVSRTGDGVRRTAEAIRSVGKKNSQTAEFMGRIASASQLQAQAAAKMSKEVSIISVVIQSNSQLAEQFDFSCGTLSDQAKTLSDMASVFYTKGEASDDEKSAPIIFDEDSGGFSVTEEK